MSISFTKVLFPTDFSELGLQAFAYAAGMAERFAAQLHCLHVVDEAYQFWTGMGPESIPVGPPAEELLALGRARMEEFRTKFLSGMRPEPATQVTIGRPFAEIIAYSRENGVDLIVMGTHGRGGIAHVLLGSTAEKVVRKAGCAVLTVRAGKHQFVMP